jgi:NADH dehydrogenase (ubiquinone) Fe-S protein 5
MASGYGLKGGMALPDLSSTSVQVSQPPKAAIGISVDPLLTRSVFPGPSRCFPFWQEVMACYVLSTSGDDSAGAAKCMNQLEDYHECLHHQKEVRAPFSCFSPVHLPPQHSPWLPPNISELMRFGVLGEKSGGPDKGIPKKAGRESAR